MESSTSIALEAPVYPAFPNVEHISAFYTGKGTSRDNHNFSFSTSLPSSILSQNLTSYAQSTSLDTKNITWPNGPWPHSGKVIIAERCKWTTSNVTGGLIPWTMDESAVRIQYDGIVTRSPDYVLGVQGADCPSVFLVDEVQRVIGLAHSGRRPTVRNVAGNLVKSMEELGARPERIIGFVAPGVGDKYNEFSWDGTMESSVRKVFEDAGREELLTDEKLRYVMNEEDKRDIEKAT